MTTLSTMYSQPPQASDRLSRRCVMQINWSLVAGGAETYALTLASNLNQDKFRSVMCGVDQGGALEPEIRRRNIPYHIMNRRQGIDLKLIWRMFQLFRRCGVDVIHTHHFNQLFYSLIAAKLLGIRIIHTEHSIEAYKKRRFCWALRLMSPFCHRLTVIGDDGERALLERARIPRSRLEIIRAAVDLSRFDVERSCARASLGLTDTDRVATIVARISPEKNHRLLLAAFARIARGQPDARLLIVGDGVDSDAIGGEIDRLNLGRCVRMLGVRHDIPLILAASDLFVLCSDREGLPIAVLEAMAAARPVVATSVGDLPQVVMDGQTGLLVPPQDVAALADAMSRLLGNPQLADRMGAAGRVHVQSRYNLQQMVMRHEKLYGP